MTMMTTKRETRWTSSDQSSVSWGWRVINILSNITEGLTAAAKKNLYVLTDESMTMIPL